MPTVTALEQRLALGGELLSVVATMKGLAAVSIHEFEEAVEALGHDTRTVELGLQAVFSIHPGLVPTDAPSYGSTVIVVIGTDQGMCGPINREIAQEVSRWVAENSEVQEERRVAALGSRVVRELAAVGVTVDEELRLASSVGAVGGLVGNLILQIDRWRQRDGVGRVVVFHQRPVQRSIRIPRTHQVTPPAAARLEAIAARPWPTRMRPGTPHPPGEVLAGLLRQDLRIGLHQAVAEAKAAEHGARLVAMQAAEQNIEEQLDRLRSRHHRLRQAEITAELLDVVSGFEALRER